MRTTLAKVFLQGGSDTRLHDPGGTRRFLQMAFDFEAVAKRTLPPAHFG